MGGGDLNLKKSWHPQTLRNVEKVWKAEQKAEAEAKKIDQLRRELDEEREREEMQRYAIDQGMAKKKSDRLEWMYSAPGQTGVNREEYLLGKSIDKSVDPLAINEEKNAEAPGASFMADDAPSTSSDLATKIRDDPLFMIRKKENEKKKELLKNPVRMKQLQQMLKADLSDKAGRKRKKEKKKRKKEKRRKDSSEERKSKDRKTSSHDKQKRSKDSESSDDSSRQTNGLTNNHQKKYHLSRNSDEHYDQQSRDMARQKRRKSSNSPERDDKLSTNNSHPKRSHRNRSSSESPSPRKKRRDKSSPHRHLKGNCHHSRSGDDHHSRLADDHCARSGNGSHSSTRRRHRSRSRSPLSNSVRGSKMGNVSLESQSFTSRKNKQRESGSTRKMTDEERERKLAEMMDNAKWRDEQRGKNVTRYKKEEEEEAKEIAKHNEKGASFVQPMKVQTFTSSTASVENRIKRNIHSLQRTPAALENFMKK